MRFAICLWSYLFLGCSATSILQQEIKIHQHNRFYADSVLHFTSLVQTLQPLPVSARENLLKKYMLNGYIPPFLLNYKRVEIDYVNEQGKKFKASIFVSPDYVSIGNNAEYMRVPLTPLTAQEIADSLHAILPTPKMVDEIYRAAKTKLAPQPLTIARDSFTTFLHHHFMIETGLYGKNDMGIIAGIKKDVVQTVRLKEPKPNRVAIYGWHRLSGKPIQPLYTGHVDWYVDYSHGIRLVYEKMLINNKRMWVKDVLNNPELRGILTYEKEGAYIRYGL